MNKSRLFFCLTILFLSFYTSCALFSSAISDGGSDTDTQRNVSSSTLKIASWNLQTFFDAETTGNEYSDFVKSSAGWGKDAYIKRLDRLCEVINAIDADVFVMEEIENVGILYDISNRLAGNSWKTNKIYDYGCFSTSEGSSIGCAVLSRYPLISVKTHSLDIRTEIEDQPSMRPIMEVTVSSGGKSLVLFVNHWKSMSGGEEITEVWRCWQESVLGAQISLSVNSTNQAILACGDFNRSIEKFTKYYASSSTIEQTNVSVCNIPNICLCYVLLQNNMCVADKCAMFSPWFLDNYALPTQGSYYYNDAWNYIDHFFSAGSAKISSFTVESNGSWADESGIPNGFKIYTGGGYSDHLPISCVVRF